MNYRKLGKWGLKVSEISVGSWITNMADKTKSDVDKEIIKTAYESGVNFFDCADAYAGGAAERFLGEVLSDYNRSSLVISTKVFFPVGKGINDRGLSRKHIFEQIDESLKNLKTDYIDLYFCHRYDSETPVEETMLALNDLVVQGKILYYGVSEWLPSQVMEGIGVIKEHKLRPMSVIQPQYNMIDRFIEDDMFDVCNNNGLGIVCFSPLAQGLLTGKYKIGSIPAESRANKPIGHQIKAIMTEENLLKVQSLCKIAEDIGVSMSNLALAWILRKKEISSVIIGASKVEQLVDNLGATNVKLSSGILSDIEKILDNAPIRRKIG